jgi:hypothetical protein
VEEVEGPPDSLSRPDEPYRIDLSDRCWWDSDDECWKTDFPPPAGFDGYESRGYDEVENEDSSERNCTPEEAAILQADRASELDAERAEDEELRDAYFAQLSAECG